MVSFSKRSKQSTDNTTSDETKKVDLTSNYEDDTLTICDESSKKTSFFAKLFGTKKSKTSGKPQTQPIWYLVKVFQKSEDTGEYTPTYSFDSHHKGLCVAEAKSRPNKQLGKLDPKALEALDNEVKRMNAVDAKDYKDEKLWYWIVRTVEIDKKSFTVGLMRCSLDPKWFIMKEK